MAVVTVEVEVLTTDSALFWPETETEDVADAVMTADAVCCATTVRSDVKESETVPDIAFVPCAVALLVALAFMVVLPALEPVTVAE